jgi:hypothetical protein
MPITRPTRKTRGKYARKVNSGLKINEKGGSKDKNLWSKIHQKVFEKPQKGEK